MLIYVKGYFKEEDSSSLRDDLKSIKEFLNFLKKDIIKNKKD